jgi:tol-pal system protein YbgF
MLSPTTIRKAGFFTVSSSSPLFKAIGLASFVLGLAGCAGRMAHPDTDSNHPKTQTADTQSPDDNTQGSSANAQADPRMSKAALNARLDAMEAKLAALNDKLDSTQHALDNFLTAHQPKMSGVTTPMTDAAGAPVAASDANMPGYVQDGAVQLYRKANILFESERYADANLAYSRFLEKYPDHALAGSAQFKIGEGYFKRKEYKQAVQEFQKVLTSYDRSPAISATLRELAESEDALGKTQEAARYRQQLTSLFPSSPAAQNLPAGGAAAPQAPQTTEPQGGPADMPSANSGSNSGANSGANSPANSPNSASAPSAPNTSSTPSMPNMNEEKVQTAPQHDLDSPPPTAPMGDKTGEKAGEKTGDKAPANNN